MGARAEEDGPGDEVGFRNVDVVTPAQKLLAYKLTVSVLPGQSLLVTGEYRIAYSCSMQEYCTRISCPLAPVPGYCLAWRMGRGFYDMI